MTAKTAPATRINALDLTVDQIEQIETASGHNLEDWPKAPKLHLYRYIYGIARDIPDELVGRMTLRDLTDAIQLDDGSEAVPT